MSDANAIGHLNLGVLVTSVMPTDPNQNMAVSLALASLAFIVTVLIGRPDRHAASGQEGRQTSSQGRPRQSHRQDGRADHGRHHGVDDRGAPDDCLQSRRPALDAPAGWHSGRVRHSWRARRPAKLCRRDAAWHVRPPQDRLANRDRGRRRTAALFARSLRARSCTTSTSPSWGVTASASSIFRSRF